MPIVTNKPSKLSDDAWIIWQFGLQNKGRIPSRYWTKEQYLRIMSGYVSLDRSALPELEEAGLVFGKAADDDPEPFVNLNIPHKHYVNVDNGVRDDNLYVEVSLTGTDYGDVLLATMMGATHQGDSENLGYGASIPVYKFTVSSRQVTDVEHDSIQLASFSIDNPAIAEISSRGETTLVGNLSGARFYLPGTSALDGATTCEGDCRRKKEHPIADYYTPPVKDEHEELVGRRVKVTYVPQAIVDERGNIKTGKRPYVYLRHSGSH